MAGKDGDKSQTWIRDERNVHLRSEFGANKKSVEDALQDQEKRTQVVSDYKPQVDKVVGNKKDDPAMQKLTEAYGDLTNISQHRLTCLTDVSQIANLEEFFNTVSHQFAQVATNLTQQDADQTPGAGAATASTPAAAQNCILSVRNNWQWISKLVKCTDIHLENSSAYHQFFHDAKEYSVWMPAELEKAAQNLSIKTASEKKDPDDGQRILLELKALISVLLNWRRKIDNLFERGQKIVPVPIRTKPIKYHRPIVSLASYKTNDIDIKESEELVLIDNTNSQSWLVRNLLSDESSVPSVICLIPGPDADAMELAMQLRLQLLGTWTVNMKKIGKTLIYWLLLWLKDSYTDKEKNALRGMPDKIKKDLLKSLALVEEVLDPYWGNFKGYQVLKERMENFRKILGEKGDAKNRDKNGEKALGERSKTAGECMEMFQDLWSNWEAYKILVESAHHGEQILISDKWEELKFADLDKMRNVWHTMGGGPGMADFDPDELAAFLAMGIDLKEAMAAAKASMAAKKEFDEHGSRIEYDKDGNKIVHNADGTTTVYDENGYRVEYDKDGNKILYDEHGNRVEFDKDGNAVLYDENGNRVEYDKDGNKIVHNKDGSKTMYDKNGYRIEYDKDGNKILYDEHGNRVEFDKDGNPVLYDENGNRVEYDAEENKIVYNKDGTKSMFDKHGNRIEYDKDGNKVLYDENGNRVEYDKDGNKIVHNKDGSKTMFDKNGYRIEYDKDGNKILYDEHGNRVEFDKDGNPVLYDENGNRVEYDAEGNKVVYNKDGTKSMFDKHGNRIEYDKDGNKILYDADGNKVEYDENGNKIVFGKDGSKTMYDEHGNRIEFDADGNKTLYDADGNRVEYDEHGNKIVYGENGAKKMYDADGNRIEYDENGNKIVYYKDGRKVVYDKDGKIISEGVWSQEDMDRLDAAFEELITAQEAETVEARERARMSSALESEKRSAETQRIEHSEQEEKRTFVITGVIDPRSKEEVSMHQAVMLGIINSKQGTYVNPETREEMPIPVAMNAGFIKVEFTTASKTKKKKVPTATLR